MTETKRDANAYLASEPIGRLLLKFSVPCVLSMLVSALYNIVDQIFIGQSVGYLGNAATNVVYPFTVTALALALLVGDGSAAKLSLSLGSGDKENSHKCIGNGILATIIIGLLLTVTGFLFTDQILRLFGVTEASYPYAREYMEVILLGIPFYIFASGMNAAIRADGSPAYSMFSTVIGAVLNLILDPVAIFVFHMGVRGAAIATVIGQVVSCFVTILYFRKPKSFRFSKASFLPDGRLLRQIGPAGHLQLYHADCHCHRHECVQQHDRAQGAPVHLRGRYSPFRCRDRYEGLWHRHRIFRGYRGRRPAYRRI